MTNKNENTIKHIIGPNLQLTPHLIHNQHYNELTQLHKQYNVITNTDRIINTVSKLLPHNITQNMITGVTYQSTCPQNTINTLHFNAHDIINDSINIQTITYETTDHFIITTNQPNNHTLKITDKQKFAIIISSIPTKLSITEILQSLKPYHQYYQHLQSIINLIQLLQSDNITFDNIKILKLTAITNNSNTPISCTWDEYKTNVSSYPCTVIIPTEIQLAIQERTIIIQRETFPSITTAKTTHDYCFNNEYKPNTHYNEMFSWHGIKLFNNNIANQFDISPLLHSPITIRWMSKLLFLHLSKQLDNKHPNKHQTKNTTFTRLPPPPPPRHCSGAF